MTTKQVECIQAQSWSANSVFELTEQEMSQSKPMVLERNDKIIKPNNDDRNYRGLVLSNKLKVILISDPKTDKSAASLSANIGALSDPWHFQGMAHFVEHALFIGSKKYPKDNSFKDFIVQHGGHTNGHTTHTETVYYFDVDTHFLAPALDQFAQFFLEPLFLEDKIERELDSVQLEFENTRTIDTWRMARIRKAVSDGKHDFSKFELGDKNTLGDKNILGDKNKLYNETIKFYQEHYSANLMALAVLGKETLDELENVIVPLFSEIVNHNLVPYTASSHPYSHDFCRKQVCMVPLKTMSRMSCFFPLPDFQQDFVRFDALAYITHLFGHEGAGSLLARLKDQGVSNTVSVHTAHLPGFSFLFFDLDLTKGVRANSEVVQAIFQYRHMLQMEPPSQRIFDELKRIHMVQFNYRDRYDPIVYVKYISSNVIKWPMERALCGRILLGDFNADAIREVLSFIKVDSLNVHVMSTAYKQLSTTFQSEHYYGTQFVVHNIEPDAINNWRNVQRPDYLRLPEPNQFIPEKFDLESKNMEPNKDAKPEVKINEKHFKVWHLLDTTYRIPKVFYGFFLKCPLVNWRAAHANLMSLLSLLFHDHVNEKFYSATLVGISYAVSSNKLGLVLEVSGFNDKIVDFIQAFVEELLDYKVNRNRYKMFEDITYNMLDNFPTRPLLNQLASYKEYLLAQTSWPIDELLQAMKEVSALDVEHLLHDVLSHAELEVFVHGNVTSDEACRVARMVHSQLAQKYRVFPIDAFVGFDSNREIDLPVKTIHSWSMDNHIHENSAVLFYYQIGFENPELLAQIQLLHQIINEPYFNQIRMKQQLAYMTFVRVRYSWSGLMGVSIEIQSAYDLDYLEARLHAFVTSMEDYISNLAMSTFEKEKASLITRLAERPKALHTRSQRLWSEITSSTYLFDRNDQIIAHLRRIDNPSPILQLYKTHLAPTGEKCRELIIRIKALKSPHLKGKEEDHPQLDQIKRVQITHIRKFKCAQVYSRLSPVLVENLS